MIFNRGLTKLQFRTFATFTKNYYKIIGVDPKASLLEIKKRYNALAKENHPDINPSQANYFKEINEAYGILGKVDERKKYDDTFLRQTAGPGSTTAEANYARYDNFYNSVR